MQIRDVLRGLPYTDTSFGARFLEAGLSRICDLPAKELALRAERLLAGLLASGIVTPDMAGKSRGHFVLTDSGVSIRAARATKRLKRARADIAIAKLLNTVAQINSNPIFLHDVSWVAVFGSYLSDEPDLGDIDVCVKLAARWKPHLGLLGREKTDLDRRRETFEAKYPPPDSFYQRRWWGSWPETYTRRFLRTDPAMVIVEPSALEGMGCPHRIIYPVTRDIAAQPGWLCERQEIVLRPADAEDSTHSKQASPWQAEADARQTTP